MLQQLRYSHLVRRRPDLDLGPKWDRTPPRYTDSSAQYGQYGQHPKWVPCSQMQRFQGVTKKEQWSLGS